MKVRLDVAAQIAKRVKDAPDPNELSANLFGESVSPETKQAISRAESREQGIAMLLMSPEFQRR